VTTIPPSENRSDRSSLDRANTISNFVIAGASVFTLLAIIFTNVPALPSWFVYLPLATLAVGILFWFYPRIGRLVDWRRKGKLARAKFPHLLLLAQEFQSLTSPQQADTITYVLLNIQQPGGDLQSTEFLQLCAWMATNLSERLQTSKRSFDSLQLGIRELYALVHSYHRVYFIQAIEKVMGIPSVRVDDKRTIEAAREAFARYLDKFQSLCKEINEALGRKAFDYYFQKSKPLWPEAKDSNN
jgi:hypothetical protein